MPASHDHDDTAATSSAAEPPPDTNRFATDTAVQRLEEGRYRGRMDPTWWIVNGPNGGYVAAVVLRAIVAEVDDPSRRPRSVTLQYLRAPVEGPVEVLVDIERSGRTVTNVSARMAQDGYMVEHGRLLDRTGRLIAESRQLAVVV